MLRAIGLTLIYATIVCMVIVGVIAYLPVSLYSESRGGGIGITTAPLLIMLHKSYITNNISNEICNVTLMLRTHDQKVKVKGELLITSNILGGVETPTFSCKSCEKYKVYVGEEARKLYTELKSNIRVRKSITGEQRVSLRVRIPQGGYMVVVYIYNVTLSKSSSKPAIYCTIDYIVNRAIVLGNVTPVYLRFLIPLGLGVIVVITSKLWRRRYE